jgi:4-amino-4-deoxy-L-arabinose transferase-like glycosyltransferase
MLSGVRRWWEDLDRQWAAAVGTLLLGAFLLRIWGVHHGLPYAYNADENAHFAPKAIGLFGHGWNPHYFVNPPAYTYLLHLVFAVWFGGREGVSHAYATDPTSVFVVARVTTAMLGTLAVWLMYLAATRFFDRRVGLLSAGLLGVSFLPVFYSHLALNDVPNLAPICLSLWGTAGVLRLGRNRDYVIAGVGLGLAAATKYTGGIVIAPLVAAVAAQFLAPGGRDLALRGLAIAGGAAVAAFLIANPHALLSFSEFKDGLTHQTTVADDAIGKLGLTQDNGVLYYLWTLTWGLGWVPALAALAAVPLLWADERRLVWVLVPGVVIFILFMGSQTRFFGRWLIPILPLMCLLASYAALEAADFLGRRRRELAPTFLVLAVIALCGQALAYSLHIGLVLRRDDTRNTTRTWLVRNVPPIRVGSVLKAPKIVVEPVVPDSWAQNPGDPAEYSANGNLWAKFSTSRENALPDGTFAPGEGKVVNIEDYEKALRPELVQYYTEQGYCYVITGSTQRGRAEAEPEIVPRALAYYRELERNADVVYRASPYGAGSGPVKFNFDWSFDYYPLAYHRPGPEMTVYRLRGGECTPSP